MTRNEAGMIAFGLVWIVIGAAIVRFRDLPLAGAKELFPEFFPSDDRPIRLVFRGIAVVMGLACLAFGVLLIGGAIALAVRS